MYVIFSAWPCLQILAVKRKFDMVSNRVWNCGCKAVKTAPGLYLYSRENHNKLFMFFFGEPFASTLLKFTLLTSTLVLRSGGFTFGGFALEWCSVASLERFSATSHKRKGTRAPFLREQEYEGFPPGTRNQGGHVKSGL